MIELEKTYLMKRLPDNLDSAPSKEIVDIYVSQSAKGEKLRLRKNGDRYEITRKKPINPDDVSRQSEQTIALTKEEFEILSKGANKRLRKLRYYYSMGNQIVEIDIFLDDLKGLALAEFEFKNETEKAAFVMPNFCLSDVTTSDFIAGSMLAGKSFEDIKEDLAEHDYVSVRGG